MTQPAYYLLTTCLLVSQMMVLEIAASSTEENAASPPVYFAEAEAEPSKSDNLVPFEDFTGRLTRNKVRMRLQPSLDAPILRELSRDDLLIVVDEVDEFYAVLPPKDVKAYVFRTFVLDNVIEGNHVNVRLEPALEAPIIAQLNNGDSIEGTVSSLNNKWLEIAPPASSRFYVCKEYIEKIGDRSVMAKTEKRREKVNDLLASAYLDSQEELKKPYEEANLNSAIANYRTIIQEYSDFPDQVARAQELQTALQEEILQKKIAYLEGKAFPKATEITLKPSSSINDEHTDDPYEKMIASSYDLENRNWDLLFDPMAMTGKMATWIPVEKAIYHKWGALHSNPSASQFYQQQLDNAILLTGILEPYSKTVRNKPGDYILVSQSNHLPIAYLYSTSTNLQERLGQTVTLRAAQRPNNNFAFPAYFILSID